MSDEYQEKRKRQRFIAKRGDTTCFWLLQEGERIPLIDLSLEGFSIPAAAQHPVGTRFPFTLSLEGIPDKIRGTAEVVNAFKDQAQALNGCNFVSIDGDGASQLREWLTVHVIANASVRITAVEAEKIVDGPSLI